MKISGGIEAVVIGAGPAGMGAAVELFDRGLESVAVFERNRWIGGVLRQCIHTGFGLDIFGEDLTGPQFARRIRKEAEKRGIPVYTETMVLRAEPKKLLVSSRENGIQEVPVKGVILAAGCRERTRENLEIPGTRPAGIFTAGQAQTLINLNNLKIGTKAVIQGSGDIGLIMARRLAIEGCRVDSVLERLPYLSGLLRNKVQCLDHFGIPLRFSRQITRILGKHRVEAVETAFLDDNFCPVSGTEEIIECDTVLFSVGLIPELEPVDEAGVGRMNRYYPCAGKDFQTDIDGIFVCGNSLHINDLADNAWLEGRECGRYFHDRLTGKSRLPGMESELPYLEKDPFSGYSANFFGELEDSGGRVCIVCPRGCILKEGEYGCSRGEVYFRRPVEKQLQRFATTVLIPFSPGMDRAPADESGLIRSRGGVFVQLPAVSLEDVEIRRIPFLKKELESVCLRMTVEKRTSVFRVMAGGVPFEIG